MTSKISERIAAFPAAAWVPAADYRRFVAVAHLAGAESGETVTVQLRRATDASGGGAANFGAAVTATKAATSPEEAGLLTAAAEGDASQLGETEAGDPYTHVGVAITDDAQGTPVGFIIAGDARFSSLTLAGSGFTESHETA